VTWTSVFFSIGKIIENGEGRQGGEGRKLNFLLSPSFLYPRKLDCTFLPFPWAVLIEGEDISLLTQEMEQIF